MVDEDLSEELVKSLGDDEPEEGGEEGGVEDVEVQRGLSADAVAKPAANGGGGAGGKSGFDLTAEQKSNLEILLDLPLKITVELGRARVLIQDILQYGQGSVVELNKNAGDSLEITVNNQLIAKGEVVVVNEKFAVRILEIVDAETRIKRLGSAGRDSTHILQDGSGAAG